MEIGFSTEQVITLSSAHTVPIPDTVREMMASNYRNLSVFTDRTPDGVLVDGTYSVAVSITVATTDHKWRQRVVVWAYVLRRADSRKGGDPEDVSDTGSLWPYDNGMGATTIRIGGER